MDSPTLFLVATPLGNLSDLSPRAREVLETVAVVLAEDTRRAGKLCELSGIKAKGFLSLHEHNEASRVARVLELLGQGNSLALTSDAGTPLLSDPGYPLVRACREAGYAVSPVPGPCAALAALTASGLPPQPFAFLGFAPRKAGERRNLLAPYAQLPLTLVFYERGSRLPALLTSLAELPGTRRCCLARELTKRHETFILFDLNAPTAWPGADGTEIKGECTLVVGPPEQAEEAAQDEIETLVAELVARERAAGGKPREIARRVFEALRAHPGAKQAGYTVKALYERIQSGS